MISRYKDENTKGLNDFFNVSFECRFGHDNGNLPDTVNINLILQSLCNMSYQIIYVISQRTGVKGTKANPTICILLILLTGDCLSLNVQKDYV